MERVTRIGGFLFRAKNPQPYPNDRFAKLEDSEGNLIQLCEPTPAALERTSDTQG